MQYYSLLKELTEAEAARLAAEKAEAERLAAEQAAAAGNYVIGDDGYLRDANGNIIGRILPDGTVVDLNGNVIGHINENGEFVGLDGKVRGKTSKTVMSLEMTVICAMRTVISSGGCCRTARLST